IFPFLERLEAKRYKQYIRVFLRQYQLAHTCPSCNGTRLRPEVLAVRIAGESIADAAARSVEDLAHWLAALEFTATMRRIAEPVMEQVPARVNYLRDFGLGYLNIDRQTRTVSGGEAQRIALANALGAQLVDALYVLDEPSIGLHPRDTERLLGLLRRLRDIGNTVVMVEHDPAAIREADWMLELGPGSGEHGGQLVYAGEGARATATLAGQYLAGRTRTGVPTARRPVNGPRRKSRGARLHTLLSVNADIPFGTLASITGVSGSGKSILFHDVLLR